MPHMQCCIAALSYGLSGLRFLPVTVNQNLASANSGGFFICTKTGIGKLILWLHFLAIKNTQRYRVLILGK
jgi:hypothetical protein